MRTLRFGMKKLPDLASSEIGIKSIFALTPCKGGCKVDFELVPDKDSLTFRNLTYGYMYYRDESTGKWYLKVFYYDDQGDDIGVPGVKVTFCTEETEFLFSAATDENGEIELINIETYTYYHVYFAAADWLAEVDPFYIDPYHNPYYNLPIDSLILNVRAVGEICGNNIRWSVSSDEPITTTTLSSGTSTLKLAVSACTGDYDPLPAVKINAAAGDMEKSVEIPVECGVVQA